MASPQTSLLAAVLLPAFLVLHSSSSLPPCPESCICEKAPLLNCSSSSLSIVPRLLQGSFSELDLSHNLLSSVALHQTHYNLRNVWLGNNSITYLSLCMERTLKDPYLRHRFRTQSRPRCQTWAPALQLLSAERNLLEQLPEGLDGARSLQVLQLSFNRISTLQPENLSRLRQLKELHLKHNLITHLHPQMFQGLDQLRVLDLSFNMVTSLHPLMYLTLRSIGTDVQLGGNRWWCNCSMRSLQRRMAYDSSKGLQGWTIVCAFPSTLSGRDLLQLQEEDFDCLNSENSPDLHQDVTVYSGSEILLSCSAQDSVLWTPSGEGSVIQQNAGLRISDVSHSNTGLYVCVSEEDHVVSVFNLQISKTGDARKARSLPETHNPSLRQNTLKREGEKQTPTQSDLTLAVCLSVFITFLLAFILGVLARPCIDVVWKRLTNKKRPSATHTVSSTEQGQYDNEAFSNVEEQVDPGPFRERRVTFSTVDFIEDSNVQYYDTVASGDQDSINNEVIECEVAEVYEQSAGDSGGLQRRERKQSDDSGSGDSSERHVKNTEFEHIPDPSELQERTSLTSSSDSSSSEKISEEDQLIKRKPTEINSPQLTEDSVQQRPDFSIKTEVTLNSMEGQSKMPGISSGPSLHPNKRNSLDSDASQDNEDVFEFSDFAESPTGESSSIFETRRQEPTSDKQKMEDVSSSSSYISEDEPTHYTVNSDPETEESDTSEASVRGVDQVKSSFGTKRPHCSVSSDSSDSDEEPMQNRRKPNHFQESQQTSHDPSSQLLSIDLRQITQIRRRLDFKVPSPSHDSSSSSDSEDEVVHTSIPPITVSQTLTNEPEDQWPSIDLRRVTKNKRYLDINAPSASDDSPSSSESEQETTSPIRKQEKEVVHMSRPSNKLSQTVEPENQWPTLDLGRAAQFKRRLDIKAPSISSDSSSSSDSEDKTKRHIKYEEQKAEQLLSPSNKTSQPMATETGNQWPTVDLGQITRFKRRIEIKAPSPRSGSSSSSDSEDETTGLVKKQAQEEVHASRPSTKVSQTVIKEPVNQWPTVDLGPMTKIRRRIDFKARSPSPDSSSSSDSEDETKGNIKYEVQEEVHMTRPPRKVSQTVTKQPEYQWPTVDLGQISQIKRRLDFKAPKQSSDSSSSSDSEDETKGHIKKLEQEEIHITRPPIQVSQTVTKEPENQWPTVDLGNLQIKRRLNIKVPSQSLDSSSSSDSEDETKGPIKKLEHEEVHLIKPPIKVSQTVIQEPGNQWPNVDLGQVTQIKRRLDFKAPSKSSDSSTSSDSEDETTDHIKKLEQVEVHMTSPPSKVSQTVTKESENQWPTVDLGNTQIKRRLDFKVPSPSPDLSSDSDSEDELKGQINNQLQEELHMTMPPLKVSQTVITEAENQWPTVDIGQVTQIKRRLDFKAPAQSSDSFEGEEKTLSHIKKQEQQQVHVSQPPGKPSQTVTKVPENQWPPVDLGQITRIKRRLDIKAPSQSPALTSSSDSRDETTGQLKKLEQEEVHMTRPPIKVSHTVTKEPENQWPTINIGQVTQIKRRLDFKVPSSSSCLSSISDIGDETKGYIKKQEQEQAQLTSSPIKAFQVVTKVPKSQWPTVDLGQITRLKRRLDIKAPSQSSDSFESEEKTLNYIKKQEQEQVHVSQPPGKPSQTVTKVPENQWPPVDVEQITRLKRRLEFKAPSQSLTLTSIIDYKDETKGPIKKLEHEEVNLIKPPIKVSQTVIKEPGNQWPIVDLGQVTQIKRRLDFKAPSKSSDSSTSSDSEDETTDHIKKLEQVEVHMTSPPSKVSQTVTKESENQWPTVDIGQITQIKRRLDFKIPSESFDSFSSNENKEKIMDRMKKQEQEEIHMSRPSIKVSQTVITVPENQWPIVDLGQVTQIKRRLDFKVPSSSSCLSSISDIGDETKGYIKKQEQEQVQLTSSPIKAFQVVTKLPKNQWPTVDLGQVTQIKRRLDFKAPSQRSESSSSNECEEKILSHIKKQEQEQVHVSQPPSKLSQTVTKVPENQWPPVDLGQVTQIKRRLDFKAQSLSPGSASSGDSEEQNKGYIKKQEQEQAHLTSSPIKAFQVVTKVPKNQWPTVDLGQVTQIKRRLVIKAPPQSFDSFTSIENRQKAMDHVKKQEQEEIHMTMPSIKVSQTVINEPENQWPIVDLGQITQIKRRLDFKTPSSRSDSSHSYGSEDKTTGSTKSQEQDMTRHPFNISQTETKETENNWPSVNLGGITQMKRRLDIKAPALEPLSPRSKNENENKDFQTQERVEKSAVSTVTENNVIRSPDIPVMNIVHTPRKDYNIKLEKYTVFSDNLESKPTNDPINATPDINPELQSRWATMNLGISRFRKRIEITSPSTEQADLSSPPLPPSSDSGSGGRPRLRRKFVGMQETDLSPVFGNKPLNVSVTMKDPHDRYSYSDYAIPSVTGEKTKPDTALNDLGSQHVNRYEDIWVGEKVSASSLQHHPHFSSSSDSKDEAINLNVPDLSLGVPRIKRRLNIKAPSLETSNPPSFISKDEKDVTGYSEMQSRQKPSVLESTDESLITYKRSIIKESSLSRNSSPPSGRSQTVDHTFITQEVESDRNTSLVSRSGSSLTFDDIVKSKIRQSRANTDVDLPHEIKWNGVGHHLPDLSTSKPERINSASTSLQEAPITELHSPSLDSSSSTSVIHRMQGGGEPDATLMTGEVFISPHKRIETSGTVSEDRGRRGLGAIKAMSLERRMWETDLGENPSASSDHYDPKDDTSFMSGQFKKDTDVLPEETLKSPPSPSLEKTRDADLLLLYGVPRYKGHSIKDPMLEPVPPVPETPPPHD